MRHKAIPLYSKLKVKGKEVKGGGKDCCADMHRTPIQGKQLGTVLERMQGNRTNDKVRDIAIIFLLLKICMA